MVNSGWGAHSCSTLLVWWRSDSLFHTRPTLMEDCSYPGRAPSSALMAPLSSNAELSLAQCFFKDKTQKDPWLTLPQWECSQPFIYSKIKRDILKILFFSFKKKKKDNWNAALPLIFTLLVLPRVHQLCLDHVLELHTHSYLLSFLFSHVTFFCFLPVCLARVCFQSYKWFLAAWILSFWLTGKLCC